MVTDSFDEFMRKRQDVRTWTEDELAIARLVWREAWRAAHQDLDSLRSRVKLLEKENAWLESHQWGNKE